MQTLLTHPSSPPEKKLKIALICDWYLPQIGGIELHIQDLARGLQKRGHQVEVITAYPGPQSIDGISVRRLFSRLLPKFHIAISARPFRELRKLFQKERYDLVHAHVSVVSPLAYAGAYLAQKAKIPTVITAHSLLERGSFLSFKFLNPFLKWSRWNALFSGVSRVVAEGFSRSLGHPVEILPNGTDLSRWKANPERFSLASFLSSDLNSFFSPQGNRPIRITSVMRLTRKKRADFLIRAIPLINARLSHYPKPVFTIIGEGPDRRGLEKKTRELKIQDQVQFLGYCSREKIQEVFDQTDVFSSPTLKEAFGIAVLEARCAGLPVVGMEGGGVSDLIESGKNGFLVRNLEEFVRAHVTLIQDADLREQMSQNTRQGLERFGWDEILNDHLKIYEKARLKFNEPELLKEAGFGKEDVYHRRYGTGLSTLPDDLSGG